MSLASTILSLAEKLQICFTCITHASTHVSKGTKISLQTPLLPVLLPFPLTCSCPVSPTEPQEAPPPYRQQRERADGLRESERETERWQKERGGVGAWRV